MPRGFIETGDGVEFVFAEVQAGPVQFFVSGADAKRLVDTYSRAFNAVNHPLEHAHVLAIARPDEFAVRAFSEPVGAKDAGQRRARRSNFFAHVQPMLEVIAHVVAGKGNHGKRIAAHHALLAGNRSSGLGTHGGGHVNAFHPGAALADQGHSGGSATSKDESIDRHALGVVPCSIQRRVVGGGNGETRIGVRRSAGFAVHCVVFGDLRRPVAALPIDQVSGQAAAVVLQAFPPHIAVVGQRDVGEDRVFVQAQHAIGVGQHVGARRHAEITRLGVDGIQAAIRIGLDPGNVVADSGDFPALKTGWGHQHREIGFTAGAWESGGNVVFFPQRVCNSQN